MTPLVSIVIPCYRGTRFLAAAIESCLRQTCRSLEVIVVDDASPEGDAALAGQYARQDRRVRVLRHPANGGVSRAFNTGFQVARGAFFTRLAQDDVFREDALEVMVHFLRARPDVGVVYCDMQVMDAAGRFRRVTQCEAPERALLPCYRMGLCILWRRAVWERVGRFRPCCDTAEDYDFFLRASRLFRIDKCVGVAPFFYREHPDQGSARFEKRQNAAFALAQLCHFGALARRHPGRLAYWKHVAGCGRRYLIHRLRLLREPQRGT